MTNESIQRDVAGYEGLYTVDIFGNVFRADGKELTQTKNQFGYMNVSLRKDGKQKQHKVHRLVAQAFIPNPLNKEQVNHIDGDKTHNTVWNLEWNTCKENINHAVKTGKFTNFVAIRIVETGQEFINITECAREIKGDIADIYSCAIGKRKSYRGLHFERIGENSI